VMGAGACSPTFLLEQWSWSVHRPNQVQALDLGSFMLLPCSTLDTATTRKTTLCVLSKTLLGFNLKGVKLKPLCKNLPLVKGWGVGET
jgi:hypothetical protein